MAARRLRQFLAALTAHISIDEYILIATFLSINEQHLFERMPIFDRRHSLDVYHTLERAGHSSPALLKAALLHDCGKVDNDGARIPLIYYGVFVVLKAWAPALYWGAAERGHGLLRPFATHAAHDSRSAALVDLAGGDPYTVAILRDYGGERILPETQLLAWADEQH